MRSDRGLWIGVVLGLGAAGVFGVGGCSEGDTRQAEHKVVERIDTAQRLCDRAVALLAGVDYTVEGMPAPLFTELGTKQPRVDVPMVARTEAPQRAVDALAKAEQVLKESLRDNAEAPAAQQALARETLGRVLLLQAYCHTFKAHAGRGDVEKAMGIVEESLGGIREHLVLQAYLAKLGEMTTTDIEALRDQIAKRISDRKAQIETNAAEITRRTVAAEEFEKQSRDKNTRAGELERESDVAKRDKVMGLFDQAQALRAEARKLLSQAELAEAESLALRSENKDLDRVTSLSAARKALVETLLTGRRDLARKRDEIRKDMAAKLGELCERVETQSQFCSEKFQLLEESEAAAMALHGGAAQAFRQARSNKGVAAGADERAVLDAAEADAMARAGALAARQWLLKTRGKRVLGDITTLWEQQGRNLPALSALQAYVAEPDKARAEASKQYEGAAKLYEPLATRRGVDRKHAWIYQTHYADAQYRLSRLRTDATEAKARQDALDKAEKAIADALQDKRESPHVTMTLQLEKLIQDAKQ